MVFGNKNDGPGGDLDRITVKKFPDQYPAEKVLQAEPVQGDSKDVAVIRPLLKQTELGEKIVIVCRTTVWSVCICIYILAKSGTPVGARVSAA